MTKAERTWLEYWRDFSELARQAAGPVHACKPGPVHWYRSALGRGHTWFYAAARIPERKIGVVVELKREHRVAHFRELIAHRAEIEQELGVKLDWQELPDWQSSRIFLYKHNMDVEDRADWPAQHQWLLDKLTDFHRVFGPRIRALVDDE